MPRQILCWCFAAFPGCAGSGVVLPWQRSPRPRSCQLWSGGGQPISLKGKKFQVSSFLVLDLADLRHRFCVGDSLPFLGARVLGLFCPGGGLQGPEAANCGVAEVSQFLSKEKILRFPLSLFLIWLTSATDFVSVIRCLSWVRGFWGSGAVFRFADFPPPLGGLQRTNKSLLSMERKTHPFCLKEPLVQTPRTPLRITYVSCERSAFRSPPVASVFLDS